MTPNIDKIVTPTLDERLAILAGPVCTCGKTSNWGHASSCAIVNQPEKRECAAHCGASIFGGVHVVDCPLAENCDAKVS